MTLDEFIARLADESTRGEWTLERGSFTPSYYVIRRTTPEYSHQCPITFLAGKPTASGAHAGGTAIGLTWEDIAAIVAAADGHRNHDRTLRQRLLHAVGLGGA